LRCHGIDIDDDDDCVVDSGEGRMLSLEWYSATEVQGQQRQCNQMQWQMANGKQ
jgi:hypothetical protein